MAAAGWELSEDEPQPQAHYYGSLPVKIHAAYNLGTAGHQKDRLDVTSHRSGNRPPGARAEYLPRRGQGPHVFAGPRLNPADHHGKDGGILPARHLVVAH